jgi:hypothetical protein
MAVWRHLKLMLLFLLALLLLLPIAISLRLLMICRDIVVRRLDFSSF